MPKENFFNKSLKIHGNKQKTTDLCITSQNTGITPGLENCSSRKAREKLSFEEACKYKVLPLAIRKTPQGEVIDLLTASNSNELEQDLSFLTSFKVNLRIAKGSNLLPAIIKAYKANDHELDRLKIRLKEENGVFNSSLIKLKVSDPKNAESSFLKELIDYAIAKEASDIHIIPKTDGSFIKLRINGELFRHPDNICSINQHKTIINRLKVLAKLNLSESRLPQDGSFKITLSNISVQIRLSLMPNLEGEKAVLRLQKISDIKSLKDLHLDRFTLNALKKTLLSESGLILFCGPTGSGKTTTMYAALGELINRNQSIVSIEDPVEISFQEIDQISLKPELNFNYPQALRAVLRQDPDILLVGEIRDAESAKIVVQAALSGHLILSTIHAGNVFQVIRRMVQFKVDPEILSLCLNLIINQRLVPLLCEYCKGKACKSCSYSSYGKRLAIAETLILNENLRNKIVSGGLNIHHVKNMKKNYSSYKEIVKELFEKRKIDLSNYKKLNQV